MNGNVFINMFPLQKEIFCTVFRTFPLTQNNIPRGIFGGSVFS